MLSVTWSYKNKAVYHTDPLLSLDTNMPKAQIIFVSDFYTQHNESEVLIDAM